MEVAVTAFSVCTWPNGERNKNVEIYRLKREKVSNHAGVTAKFEGMRQSSGHMRNCCGLLVCL